MKTKDLYPIHIDLSCLPKDIYVSFQPFKMSIESVDQDILQNISGRNLIKEMAELFLQEEEVQIHTQKNEKPQAFCNDTEVSVSFSHTKDGVAGAISFTHNVGCDMENAARNVHPRLVDRMKNSGENENLYEIVDPVRIWTLKEATLKMIGTGLRKPMNSIQVSMVSHGEFSVEFDNGKRAKICSFQHRNHWISVCYQKCADG